MSSENLSRSVQESTRDQLTDAAVLQYDQLRAADNAHRIGIALAVSVGMSAAYLAFRVVQELAQPE